MRSTKLDRKLGASSASGLSFSFLQCIGRGSNWFPKYNLHKNVEMFRPENETSFTHIQILIDILFKTAEVLPTFPFI